MTGPTRRPTEASAWGLVLLRGVVAVLFGLYLLLSPGATVLGLVLVFAVYAVVDGIAAIVLGVRHRRTDQHWVWQIAQGLISIAAGVIAFLVPGLTVLFALVVIAVWAVVGGVAGIVEAVAMRRRRATGAGWALVAGVLDVLAGIVLLALPGPGLLVLLWLVGVYAVVSGVVLSVWAFRLRSGRATAVTPATGVGNPA